MRLLGFRRLAQVALLGSVLFTSSSCQMIAPLVAMPFRLLSTVLGMVSSNPVGTAASAAAIF
jgi:hypothetical protein